ncbi:MAG: type 2 lanthipeptide synthetase LanM family protein [Acidobacteriota bacterium]
MAPGDPERFEKRLRWDGLDLAAVRRACNQTAVPEDPPPSWASILEDALAVGCGDSDPEADDLALRAATPIPFEEILLPFVRVGRRRLRCLPCSTRELLTPEAHAAVERGLIEQLSRTAELSLYVEFSAFRAMQPFPSGGSVYAGFTDGMLGSGLVELCHRYPVLARLLATQVERWIDSTRELFSRLAVDWPLLCRTFCAGADPGPVTAVQTNLSDPHCGGRTVSILHFASGVEVVYKPKDLGSERAYYDLLTWLNSGRVDRLFRVLSVLDRAEYGWVERVSPVPCDDAAGVERYYERAGMLTCLAYLLGATDLHSGNLIANGEQPILIDLEMLFSSHVTAQPGRGAAGDPRVGRAISASVLRTGLVPVLYPGENGLYHDGGLLPRDEKIHCEQWIDVNTDRMARRRREMPPSPIDNVPRLDGSLIGAEGYIGVIADGFRKMYGVVISHRDQLLSPTGPLRAFQGQRMRFLFRDTGTYDAILRRTLHPKFLTSGLDRSVEIEALKSSALDLATPPPLWPAYAAEQEDLEQLDIPYFSAQTDGTRIRSASGRHHADVFTEAAYQGARARLSAADMNECERQVDIMRVAFASSAIKDRHKRDREQSTDPTNGTPSPDEALREARAIAREIIAVGLPDGAGKRWFGLVETPERPDLLWRDVGPALFAGNAGIALFFAALARIAGDEDARQEAVAIFDALSATCEDAALREHLSAEIGIGAGTGIGGIVYSLTRAGQWLGRPAWIEAGRSLAIAITEERIARDLALDIVSGTAGALLGLLAAYDATAAPEILSLAEVCGARLLAARARDPRCGLRAWPTLGGRMTTGFAHGAAGIAYALQRLAQTTGDETFREAARESQAFERGLKVTEVNNWLEEVGDDRPHDALWCSWCHGAAGIGMARLGERGTELSGDVRSDVDTAVTATVKRALEPVDQLCCGNFGRVDFLLRASERLGRPELRDHALETAAAVIRRAHRRRIYGTNANDAFRPGFFQGIAGIGYELLRLYHRAELPSVLLWE